jgi:hypothetical protein
MLTRRATSRPSVRTSARWPTSDRNGGRFQIGTVDRLQIGTPAAFTSERVAGLSRNPHPEQGCAIAAHGSADRPDFQRADLGRAPSSIWPDVICDRHTGAR